jgi:proteic killer suppression protein
VIVSFGDKATEVLFHARQGEQTRRFPPNVVRAAIRKLDVLNAARSLQDMASSPGNRLEALKGDLKGFFSVRVNEQWRIVFRWDGGDAYEVSVVDYH